MLQSLTIKNIALIDNLTIELGEGFNVLTGETGAGKSLIIDSLSLLLGEKADKSLVSYGENFATVEAVFYTEDEQILGRLEEFGLERENTIVITRKLSVDGKNECRVNGKTFTLSMLKSITAPLMDLHGQFQHQEILKETNQLFTLDEFGKLELKNAKEDYKKVYFELKSVKKQLSEFDFDVSGRERMLDLYRYQIAEIEDANFVQGEEEELKNYRMKVLSHEKIVSSLGRILGLFNGENDDGLVSMVKKCDYEFGEILKYFPEQEELSSRYELQDIAESVESLLENMSFDEEKAAANEKRLDLLSSLKKKYGSTIDEINEYLASIKSEYEKLDTSAEKIEKLTADRERLTSELVLKAKKLTELRKKIATEFEKRVKSELDELSMKNAEFSISFSEKDVDSADETGLDKVEYLFSANSGQPLKPLSKIASGGEMSRFMLAVKNITADIDRVDTMIFDEIDTGISGNTANVLAEKLLKIGKKHQVICVTHLAQVASFGQTHFYISKSDVGGKTKTNLELLDAEKKVDEIARLIGGEVSEYSKNHAKLMIEASKNVK